MSIAIPDPITLVYKTVDGVQCHLDIYATAVAGEQKARRAFVFFHGGGLVCLNRKTVSPYIVQSALIRGWMLISVDYRLLPQVNGIDILADVKAAWRFIFEDLSASHPEFSLEKEKVIVGGQSAGGYLAYLAAAHVRPRPTAVLSIYGASTFEHENGRQLRKQILTRDDVAAFLDGAVTTGETPKLVNPFQPSTSEAILFDEYLDQAPSADDRGLLLDYFLQENLYVQVLGTAPELNPLNYITKDYPPTVIIHGTNDRYVPIDTSRLLVSRLTAVGVKVKFIQVLGADHSFEHFARATDSKTSKLWSTYLAPIFSYLDLFVFSD